jgi:hypothetical protein
MAGSVSTELAIGLINENGLNFWHVCGGISFDIWILTFDIQ